MEVMLDFLNEIFTAVATAVRTAHSGVTVTGEYTRKPSKLPAVTLDETENVAVAELEDSSQEENFSALTYRMQVFSNKTSGKKAEARAIFATADQVMRNLGFRRVTYTTTPEIYESTIYSITATYEAVISADGVTYKR
jgi:hypothetical protein